MVGVALERGGSSKLEPRLDHKRTICMIKTDVIMKKVYCDEVRLADARVARQQTGKAPKAVYKKSQATVLRLPSNQPA